MSDSDSAEVADYTSFRNFLSCSGVQDIEIEYRCDYVKNNTECQDRGFFLNYIDIMYCTFRPTSNAALYEYMLIFLCLVFLMFLILGTVADKYFCPSLEMLSKVLGLSEHMAGITLLAFGNGSPDIFTSLASLDDDTVTLFSNVLSGAIFVAAFVGGVICVMKPFRINGSAFIRDTMFFILGVLYVNNIMESDNSVTRIEAISFFSIYFFYMAVITIDLQLIKKTINKMEKSMLSGGISVFEIKNFGELKEQSSMEVLHSSTQDTLNIERTRASYYGINVNPNENLVEQLFVALNPIDENEWWDSGRLGKVLLCIKAPIYFSLALFIPSVNYELERHGWSKLLNCSQVITLPLITFFLMFLTKSYFGIPIFLYPLIITIPLAILIFMSSRTDKAPRFHVGFACLSAYGSSFVIYSSAAEVVEILYILGLVLNCSNSFLGCTLLAWGNGIGDLVTNTTLASHGYHKMAFAACIGGPFFNTLLGIGLVLVSKTMSTTKEQIYLPGGPFGANCYVFLIVLLFGILIWSSFTNFHVRRSVGVFSLFVYCLFLIYMVFSELELIQTYAETKAYGVDFI